MKNIDSERKQKLKKITRLGFKTILVVIDYLFEFCIKQTRSLVNTVLTILKICGTVKM